MNTEELQLKVLWDYLEIEFDNLEIKPMTQWFDIILITVNMQLS